MGEMAAATRQNHTLNADEAFQRLRAELGASKLADAKRIAGLSKAAAARAVRGEFEFRTFVVERRVVDIEEPLPGGTVLPPAVPLDPWAYTWPPSQPEELRSLNFDVRASYAVIACPDCRRSGVIPCKPCGGRGVLGNPPTRCGHCNGIGTIACPRCRQSGQLLVFKRVVQKVRTQKNRLRLPEGTPGVPSGPASGEVEVALALGFRDDNQARAALTAAAPSIAAVTWLPRVVQELAAPPPDLGANSRVGWRVATGRWYDGWQLQCQTGGKQHEFFVPDTEGTIVGPRLRSPVKLAVIGGIAVCVIALAIGLVTWRAHVAAAAEAEIRRKGAAAEAAAAEAAATERARVEAAAKAKRIADAQAAVAAFERDKEAVIREADALEGLVRSRKWEPASTAASELQRKLNFAHTSGTPLAKAPWVLALQGRLDKLKVPIDAEEKKRKEAEEKKQAAEAKKREAEEAREAKKRAAAEEKEAKQRAKIEAENERRAARAGAVEIDAISLWREYHRNEVAADDRFKGKDLVVSGRVQSVDKDFLDNIVVRLRSPNELMSTSAYVRDSEKSASSRLSKGESVELRCTCDGMVLGSPVLRSCTIL